MLVADCEFGGSDGIGRVLGLGRLLLVWAVWLWV